MLSRRALIGGGLAWLAAGRAVQAQDIALDLSNLTDARLAELVRGAVEATGVPALSVAVVKDGVVKCAAYGMADLEGGLPATPDTAFQLASVGKQLLASGVMLLVEDGKLGLDDPATRYLQGAPAAWDSIMVRHLLSHTSGLRRNPVGYNPAVQEPDAELIRRSYARPLQFTPGSGYAYSNLGYYVLGEIARVVADAPWHELVEKRVLAPAGMIHTRPANRTDGLPRVAKGYKWQDGRWTALAAPVALRPSGGFASTALDLMRWDRALRSGRVLSRATREAMWSRVMLSGGEVSSYGFGWGLRPRRGRVERLTHSGLTTHAGFKSRFMRWLEQDLAVIILTNNVHTMPLRPQRVVRLYR
jgi:CubicO group peptidase (beta-lactamase class C family)